MARPQPTVPNMRQLGDGLSQSVEDDRTMPKPFDFFDDLFHADNALPPACFADGSDRVCLSLRGASGTASP